MGPAVARTGRKRRLFCGRHLRVFPGSSERSLSTRDLMPNMDPNTKCNLKLQTKTLSATPGNRPVNASFKLTDGRTGNRYSPSNESSAQAL